MHAALHAAQEAQKRFFDRKKGVSITFHKGDWVWLEAKTRDSQPLVKTMWPMAKLDSKCFGPFQVLTEVGQAAYWLNIPES